MAISVQIGYIMIMKMNAREPRKRIRARRRRERFEFLAETTGKDLSDGHRPPAAMQGFRGPRRHLNNNTENKKYSYEGHLN